MCHANVVNVKVAIRRSWRGNKTLNADVLQVKIWFQNRRSKYKKLLKQFGLSAGRGAVMESTVSSDLAECSATSAAAAVDIARIKSSPQSFDGSVDECAAAAAATSTTTDDMSTVEFGASVLRPPGASCWSPPPPPPMSIDNSQHYLATATYDLTSSMTAAAYTSQQDFMSVPRTTCYQPWCLSTEHNLFT